MSQWFGVTHSAEHPAVVASLKTIHDADSQRIAQELMRHSAPKLTANVYVDAGKLLLSDAISSLPVAKGVYQIVAGIGSKAGHEIPDNGMREKAPNSDNPLQKDNLVQVRVLEGLKESGAAIRSRT